MPSVGDSYGIIRDTRRLTLGQDDFPELDGAFGAVSRGVRVRDGAAEQFEGTAAMSSFTYRSSRPDRWTMPRPYQDASLRFRTHGPIQPMERQGFWARVFGR